MNQFWRFKTVVFYCSFTLGCWWRFLCHLYQLPSVEKPFASMKATVSSLTSTIWDLLGWLNRFMALTSWRIGWTGGAFLRDIPYFRLSRSQDNLISGGDERFISVSNLTKISPNCTKLTKLYKLTAHVRSTHAAEPHESRVTLCPSRGLRARQIVLSSKQIPQWRYSLGDLFNQDNRIEV